MSKRPEGEAPRWLDDRKNVDKVFYALVAVCALVVLADLFYEKKAHFELEGWIGFHAGFGFLAYVGLITLSKGLRKLVMRGERYYPDAPEPNPADAEVDDEGGRDA
ncbi:MAG: hypothetical protein OXT09_24520 [Myxococcales bacterium]|nr:hypothetical protein [Myxococcales bacterium]